MQEARYVTRAEELRTDTSSQLLLPLLLILLCFFIVLVGHSTTREERVVAAIGSVTEKFRGVARSDPDPPTEAHTRSTFVELLTDLQRKVRAINAPATVFETGGGAVLRFRVSFAQIFDGDGKFGQASEGFRAAIAEATTREIDGMALEAEISVSLKEAAAAKAIDMLARDLVGRGVPPHRIALGNKTSDDREISVALFVRSALPLQPTLASVVP